MGERPARPRRVDGVGHQSLDGHDGARQAADPRGRRHRARSTATRARSTARCCPRAPPRRGRPPGAQQPERQHDHGERSTALRLVAAGGDAAAPGVLGQPAGDHVADPLADVHGVVADALVVAADEGELHRGLHVAGRRRGCSRIAWM